MSILAGANHPKIYAYTTPTEADTPWVGKRDGYGLIKVGYTERDARERIEEQLNPVKLPTPIVPDILVVESAITNDDLAFKDHDVHKELQRAGVHRVTGEWFECTREEVEAAIVAIKAGDALTTLAPRRSFSMRPEQRHAVEVTSAYLTNHADAENPPHFLWNAKMRFGKTFTTYQLAKAMGWTRMLVLTYKPAVEGAWREDLLTHTDFDGWRFKGKEDQEPDLDNSDPLVWFASFQDVLGTDDEGNPKEKNEPLYLVDWDAVVIDEYHFGAWRDAARSIYLTDKETGLVGDSSEKRAVETPDLDEDFAQNLTEVLDLDVRNFLYLSGTPFRALTEGEFLEDQVFNWTYSDEQRAKTGWSKKGANPYSALPKMLLLAYEMPESLKEIALNNQSEFSLTEFFRTEKREDSSPQFVHEPHIQKWLDLLRGQDIKGLWAKVASHQRPPLPFEDSSLLVALQHTVWYMPSVAATEAMRDLLEASHNTFYHDYEVVVAAGPKAGMGEKALPPVIKAIGKPPQDSKSITLSCGKLMTGVTVPPWAGILMLRELRSPESYFQAAFRVQSPWSAMLVNSSEGGTNELVFKEHCYVLDFSPNRALRQIVDYATRLRAELASERDDEAAIEEFLEFLPVLSFDGYAMTQLHAGDVIDFLTRGVSATMLARRWNSPELITLDLKAMETLLADEELLESLEQIEMFRNITNDLTAMITTNKELRQKDLAKQPLSKEEKGKKKEATDRRKNLRDRLQRFITRLPAFMYLTDDREKTIKDIIAQVEPDLFEKVTGLKQYHFEQLANAGVFNDSKMNDAVWKFRTFEEPSLHYLRDTELTRTVGGWSLHRDERFARLIDAEILEPGDSLNGVVNGLPVIAVVGDNYGLLVDGIRHATPDDAAAAASGDAVADGWGFWQAETSYGGGTLDDLAALVTKQ